MTTKLALISDKDSDKLIEELTHKLTYLPTQSLERSKIIRLLNMMSQEKFKSINNNLTFEL